MAEIILKEAGKPVTRLFLDAAGLTVGSHPKNELVLTGDLIQSVHARIYAPEKNAFVLEVMSPGAQVLLNGKPVSRQAPLKTGDEITLGPHRMTVDLHARRKARRASPPLRADPTMLFSEESPPLPKASRLVWMSGKGIEEEFLLKKGPMVLGRGQSCDIFVDQETISKRHAELRLEGQDCLIRDLDSLNGIVINGRAATQARLKGGERIRLGKVDFQYVPFGQQPALGPQGRSLPRWVSWVLAALGLVLVLCSGLGLFLLVSKSVRFQFAPVAYDRIETNQIVLESPPRSICMGHLSDSRTVGVLLVFDDRIEGWKRTEGTPVRCWSAQLPLHQACSPLLLDVDQDGAHEVIAVTVDPKIVCLEGATGTLTPWGTALPEYPDADPVVCYADEDQVPDLAVGTRDGRIRFLSGRRYFEEVRSPAYLQDSIAALCSFVSPDGDSVVLAAADRRVYAMDAGKGTLAWTGEVEGELMDLAAFVGEAGVWAACMTPNDVYLFEGRTGALLATARLPGPSPWPPVSSQCEDRPGFYVGLLGGSLYFLSKDGVFTPVPNVSGASLVPFRVALPKRRCPEMILPRSQDLLIMSQPDWEVLGQIPLSAPVRTCPVGGDWKGGGELSILVLDGKKLLSLNTQVPVPRNHLIWLGESEWRNSRPLSGSAPSVMPLLFCVLGLGVGLLLAVGGSIHGIVTTQSMRG